MARVLLIEDDPFVRASVVDLLSLEQHAVLAFESSGPLADAVRDFQPHVILLDVYLPDESGTEAVKRLRADGVTTPILLYSAGWPKSRMKDAAHLARIIGAQGVLAKPFDIDDLLARVATLAGEVP